MERRHIELIERVRYGAHLISAHYPLTMALGVLALIVATTLSVLLPHG